MLKKLLFVCSALVLVLTASAQVHQRRVLVEEFTNASCGPCASQNPGFNAVLKDNYDIVTAIKFQVNFPGFDPMNQQNPTEVNTRRLYYGVDGVPHGVVNGVSIANDCNGYEGAPACLNGTEVTNAYSVLTPVTMSVSHSISATYDSVFVQVSVTSDSALSGALRLHVAVMEEEIYFDEAPGTNGETEFFQVMRKMLPNANGTTTGDFAAGETKTYSFAWKIGYAYDLNQLGAVAWLQNNDTKEVWQSARSLPTGDAVPDAGVDVLVSNALLACAPGYSPAITITNSAANPLTTAELRWRVGNAAWQNFTWTGDLAPGASELITLDTAFSQAGSYKVEVQVLGSNNGIQTNIINPTKTLQIKTLFDAPTTLPFNHGFQTGSVPPPGWTLYNVVDGTATQGWKLATNAGSGSSRSTRCNFFDFANGEAILVTPKMDLSQADGVTTLSFDHAYAYYSAAYFDSLRVDVSNDCGNNWVTVFHDGYQGLATAPSTTAAFTPTASQWENNSIDISDFNGSAELLVRFVGESGFGNNLYVDNINVTALVGVKELELSSFSLRPNPTRDVAQVRFGLDKPQSIQLSVFSADGTLVQSRNLGDLVSGEHTVTLDANSLPSGSYRVVLMGKEGVANAQWIIMK